jgi:hypothetical protein
MVKLERAMGFEPTTPTLAKCRSPSRYSSAYIRVLGVGLSVGSKCR